MVVWSVIIMLAILLIIVTWYIYYILKMAYAEMNDCLLYTSPSPRDRTRSRMPSSA